MESDQFLKILRTGCWKQAVIARKIIHAITKAVDVVLVEVLSKSKSNQLKLLAQEVAMVDHIVCIHKQPLNVKCSQREGQCVKGFCVCGCLGLFRPQMDD